MSWVYFIREGLDGNVKIGTTTSNPHSRRRSMQTGNSSDLVLLAAVQGDDGLEKRLHARFAGARLRGEWFTPTVELLAFIEGVLLSHPLPEDNGDDAWPFTAEQAEWMVGFFVAERKARFAFEAAATNEFVRDDIDDPHIAQATLDELYSWGRIVSHDSFSYSNNPGHTAGIKHYRLDSLQKRLCEMRDAADAKIDRLRAKENAPPQSVKPDTEEYN